MIAAALAYARAGFPVFPCNPTSDKSRGSKAPLVPGESAPGRRDGGHWLATTEAGQIENWWRRWPQALIGFPTGARTRAVVIDLDPREAPLEAMVQALTAWCGGGLAWADPETGEILRPAVAETQSGGLHFYFAAPAGMDIKNRANLFGAFLKTGEAKPALAHIDVRGEGGYVIAPPSRMENGAAYSWHVRPAKDDAGAWHLPPMPPALRKVITRERLPHVPQARPVARRPVTDDAGLRRLIDKKIDGILDILRRAAAGERNHCIFWAACRMGEIVRGGFMDKLQAQDLIYSNLPTGVSAFEPKARKTVENGLEDASTPAFDPRALTGGAHGQAA